MLFTRSRTKRPREALLQLVIEYMFHLFSIGGSLRAPVRYHPYAMCILTGSHESGLWNSDWWVV
jgi:hypothetical protein